MTDSNLRRLWSEGELDRTLAHLHSNVRTDEAELARARTMLLRNAGASATAPGPGRTSDRSPGRVAGPARRPALWLGTAAAVAALLAGTFVVQDAVRHHPVPNNATVASGPADLRSVIETIGAVDEPIPPGRYRYLRTHDWRAVATGSAVYLQEQLIEQWQPADPDDEWLRRSAAGNVRWIAGSARDTTPVPPPEPSEERAPRGEFTGLAELDRSALTPDLLARLPMDPRELYEWLRARTLPLGNPHPDLAVLEEVTAAVTSGRVPAWVRTNLYQALAYVPSLTATSGTTWDGRTGLSLSVDRHGEKRELIVDRATGRPLGERWIALAGAGDIPAGTPLSDVAYTTRIAERIGIRPD